MELVSSSPYIDIALPIFQIVSYPIILLLPVISFALFILLFCCSYFLVYLTLVNLT